MAVKSVSLDRKARTALILLMSLLVAGLLYFMMTRVDARLDERSSGAPAVGDELAMLPDGSTMLVKPGSGGQRILAWLNQDEVGKQTFNVGNGNFVPDTAGLTHEGWEHLAQFAQMLKSHSDVSAVVLVSPHHGDQGTLKLEQSRADRIHDQVLSFGVDAAQISVTAQHFEPGHNAAADEGLEVVLTNRK